jgi:hypothetical protein
MGKNSNRTPPLDTKGKKEYLDVHLFYELHWLLHAATEWSIQDELNLGIAGSNVQNYAMDSAFLHARVLFEFFCGTGEWGNYYRCREFVGVDFLKSDCYSNWAGSLHRGAMHAQGRSGPAPLKSAAGEEKELKEMPVEFAHEILRLWKEFEERLGKSSAPGDQELQKLAREKRHEAIKNARCVLNLCVENSEKVKDRALERFRVFEPVFVFAD